MKKIIIEIVFGALLLASTSFAQTTTPATNASCAKAAVQKRDAAIATTIDTFATAFKSALVTRTNNVSLALDITTKKNRKDAMKKALMTFRNTKKNFRTAFDRSRKSAWDTFRADMRACGVVNDEHGNAGEDNL